MPAFIKQFFELWGRLNGGQRFALAGGAAAALAVVVALAYYGSRPEYGVLFGDLKAEGPHSLAFFDDHVSHAQRLRDAHGRGFRTVILDDDVPAEALFVTGDPPAPTGAMLADPAITPGTEVAWTYRGRKFHHVVTVEALTTRALIAERLPAPDLAPATWQSRHNGISLVRLRG